MQPVCNIGSTVFKWLTFGSPMRNHFWCLRERRAREGEERVKGGGGGSARISGSTWQRAIWDARNCTHVGRMQGMYPTQCATLSGPELYNL